MGDDVTDEVAKMNVLFSKLNAIAMTKSAFPQVKKGDIPLLALVR